MVKPLIYVDFNTMNADEKSRVYIAQYDDYPSRITETLYPGMTVILFDEELEVEAIIEIVTNRSRKEVLLAIPNWSTKKSRS